ncbi:MAG: xanthine dehydrogenase molybdopterin binding subunit [Trueperaceae bacterium]|nr:MAG: xanthine dehydrogenase molybdopterin binding subunit [Trueperaceae bacterium]
MSKGRPHESAVGHVSGSAVYTDDQRPLSGMLSCFPVLAPHARARITRLEPGPALEQKGVVAVLTHRDIPGLNDTGSVVPDEVLLPEHEVSYWGQAVAWVVAESEESARLGAEKMVVSYQPLDPILDLETAIQAESFHGKAQVIRRGNPSDALEKAAHLLEGEVDMDPQDHFYLETQVSWAVPDSEGYLQVYASTQHPSETQAVIAHVLGLPANRVVVTSLRMGGGFGGKESQANPYAAIAALAARHTGRPVRVRLKREHDMILTGKRHGFLGRYRVGFSDDGTLEALELELFSDGGWSSDLSHAVLQRAMFHSDNAYFIPNMRVSGRVCKTNKASNTAFRGFGGPQGMLVIEEIVDRVARELGLPPHHVRERNFYRRGREVTHYGQTLTDDRTLRVWNDVKEAASFEARLQEVASFNQQNAHRKRGLGLTPVKFGISFTNTPMNQAGAYVLVYLDGSVQVNHGGTEMGQGLHTKMLQVAARALGVKEERVRIMPTSTDKVPNTSPTAASSGSDLNGMAVRQACEVLKTRIAGIAAKQLGLNTPEELVCKDDTIYPPGEPERKLSFDEVVARAYVEQVSLAAAGYYRTPNIYFDKSTGRGRPFHYFAYGCALSEVEVDGFTGQFTLRRVDITHDVGDSLNELVDRGQIEGGFVQGLGWLTSEAFLWDENGRPLTTEPSTYKIPTIGEVPEAFQVRLLERAEQPGVIYGSKAVGEPPFMLALSVREALREAVASFGTAHYVPLASPATPEAILRAIDGVRNEAEVADGSLITGD